MRAHLLTVTLCGFALFVAGCAKSEAPVEPPADPAQPRPVCCESFGYGAQMVKCCESYDWSYTGECTVPEGLVGGGKEKVADEKCANIR